MSKDDVIVKDGNCGSRSGSNFRGVGKGVCVWGGGVKLFQAL